MILRGRSRLYFTCVWLSDSFLPTRIRSMRMATHGLPDSQVSLHSSLVFYSITLLVQWITLPFFFAVGFLFVIIQQVILLDLAYIWNEKWVNYATDKDSGSSSLLTCLVVICLSIYAMCGTAIGVMYWTFSCSQNLAILSITVILCFLATFYQLFMTERGSLLTSAIMTGYATYLCYSSISLDPHPECNPTIGNSSQNWSQIMGMCLTAISVSLFTERYLLPYYSLRHTIIIYTISCAGLLGVLCRKSKKMKKLPIRS